MDNKILIKKEVGYGKYPDREVINTKQREKLLDTITALAELVFKARVECLNCGKGIHIVASRRLGND